MSGSVTKRGKKSWRIKFELAPDPITGRRRYHMETVRGTKREAEMQLAKRLNSLAEGRYVAPNRRDYRHLFAALDREHCASLSRCNYNRAL